MVILSCILHVLHERVLWQGAAGQWERGTGQRAGRKKRKEKRGRLLFFAISLPQRLNLARSLWSTTLYSTFMASIARYQPSPPWFCMVRTFSAEFFLSHKSTLIQWWDETVIRVHQRTTGTPSVVTVWARWQFCRQYFWRRWMCPIFSWSARRWAKGGEACRPPFPTGPGCPGGRRRGHRKAGSAHVARNRSCWRPEPCGSPSSSQRAPWRRWSSCSTWNAASEAWSPVRCPL